MKNPKKETRNKKIGARKIAGGCFTVLSLLLLGQVTVVMSKRIRSVANPHIYKKNLFAETMLGLTILLASLDITFLFFGKAKNPFLKVIGWIVRITVFFCTAVVLFFGGKIVIGSLIRHRKSAEYAIVLGMALENGRPTKDLLYRLNAALEFLEANPNAKLVITGGNPDKNGVTEAEVMEKMLIKRGVKKERIILEDQSESTKTNFRNTMEIVGCDSPIVLITSNYHMNRAVKIAKKAGFQTVYRLPARSEFFPYATNVFWEVLHNINEYTGIVKDK